MDALVHVILVDADSGATLTETDLASAQLPATFAEPTTLSLGGDTWSVVEADPFTARERLATGHLRLTLRRMAPLNPKDILFSLPTISDELPRCEPGSAGLTLHEDDWRQVELCSTVCAPAVTACLAQITLILEEKRHPSGTFKEIHIRREVPDPLEGTTVTKEALRAAFPGAVDLDGVAVSGSGRVVDGFAFGLGSGLCIHGFWRDGRAAVLAFQKVDERAEVGSDAGAIAALMAAHGLELVNWCRRAVAVNPGDLANAL